MLMLNAQFILILRNLTTKLVNYESEKNYEKKQYLRNDILQKFHEVSRYLMFTFM